jgi:RHS repeat-associated protein
LVDAKNPTGYAQVVEELVSLDGQPPSFERAYTHGLDLISRREANASKHFYCYDGHGSVRFQTSANGTITRHYTYDAFGIRVDGGGHTAEDQYLYAGEQYDQDLGLYYLRARYYSPNAGRFWTMDTFEGSQGDPLSLHKYVYAADNPVNMVDPSGHKAAFSRADAAAIGREVHRRVGQDFVKSGPPGTRVTAQSVFTALGLPNPPSGGTINGVGRLFPDLVDLKHKEVYEIKPISIGGTATGAVQLGGYVLALNKLDPTGGWGVGIGPEHYNSFQVFMLAKPLAVVTVMPPVFGMIYYEAVTPTRFVGRRATNVATANNARLQQHTGIATLLGLLGGI